MAWVIDLVRLAEGGGVEARSDPAGRHLLVELLRGGGVEDVALVRRLVTAGAVERSQQPKSDGTSADALLLRRVFTAARTSAFGMSPAPPVFRILPPAGALLLVFTHDERLCPVCTKKRAARARALAYPPPPSPVLAFLVALLFTSSSNNSAPPPYLGVSRLAITSAGTSGAYPGGAGGGGPPPSAEHSPSTGRV
jgi:hypothetical protein